MQATRRLSRNEGDNAWEVPPRKAKGVILLIDVNDVDAQHWPSIMAAARSTGQLKSAHAIGPDNSKAMEAATVLGIEYITVPRPLGWKDSSDVALATHTARLATQHPDFSIGLALSDVDFLFLAQDLVAWGHEVAIFMLEGHSTQSRQVFSEGGCRVVTYRMSPALARANSRPGQKAVRKEGRVPKLKVVLQSNGEGKFEPIAESDNLDRNIDWEEFRPILSSLGYVLSADASMVTAMIKLAFTKGVDMVVYPEALMYNIATELLHERAKRDWKEYSCNLAYFCPQLDYKAKERMNIRRQDKYGTAICRALVDAGGPFMLQDSPTMVASALRRLGYLDDDADPDLNEAIDAFCAVAGNHKELVRMGLNTPPQMGVDEKCAFLRQAFLSPLASGRWSSAPLIGDVTGELLLQGVLTKQEPSSGYIYEALLEYAKIHRLPASNTYKRLVFEVFQHILQARAPSKEERQQR